MTNTDFEDRKSTIRAELQERARARATITYGEAAAMVGLAHQGLSGILNDRITAAYADLALSYRGLTEGAYLHGKV